jgi:hypothetical protein
MGRKTLKQGKNPESGSTERKIEKLRRKSCKTENQSCQIFLENKRILISKYCIVHLQFISEINIFLSLNSVSTQKF